MTNGNATMKCFARYRTLNCVDRENANTLGCAHTCNQSMSCIRTPTFELGCFTFESAGACFSTRTRLLSVVTSRNVRSQRFHCTRYIAVRY
jgi:hypothetical protein